MPEIERKFRLTAPPPADALGAGEAVLQGYLFVDTAYELRLRQKGELHYLTFKGAGSLSREEWERSIPLNVFQALWPNTNGRTIDKTRYSISHQGRTLEVDIYHGVHTGLITLECEFDDEKSAESLILPHWATDAVDVTADIAYKNKNLAVRGLPR